MTSKLKCPVCNHKLYQTASEPATYCCLYKDCQSDFKFAGSKELWQALIQAKQDLEQYERKDNLQQQLNANNNQIQENYKQIVQIDEQIIENLEKDLQTAVQALKNMSLGNVPSLPDDETLANAMCNYARDTLKQIEHKE